MCDAGFLPPTSGTAIVNGFDIRHDIDKVRRSLGLCPQHNILFDNLTVEEHLIFFTKVRFFHYFAISLHHIFNVFIALVNCIWYIVRTLTLFEKSRLNNELFNATSGRFLLTYLVIQLID